MTLEQAIALAAGAHQGQVDRQGLPYILHPLRVMLAAKTEDEQIVAVLHDTIEDTFLTLDDLAKVGASCEIIQAVGALTHATDEDYPDYIERLAKIPLARAVKLLDLRDNMARKDSLGAPARARLMDRYMKALAYLDNYDLKEKE